jgi:hypothetical protein
MRRALCLFSVLSVFGALAGAAPAITNGTPDLAHPYVGLLAMRSGGNVVKVCSGFLVSPTLLVTAGHCTAEIQDAGAQALVSFAPTFDPSSQLLTGTAITHPDYALTPKGDIQNDLGVVLLDEPVTGVGFAELPSVNLLAQLVRRPVGVQLTTVGYGASAIAHGGGRPQPVFLDTRQTATARLIASRSALTGGFVQMTNNPGNGGGICFGDSGGPVLLGSSNTVVAVNSYLVNANCAGTSFAARVDTPAALDFISLYL